MDLGKEKWQQSILNALVDQGFPKDFEDDDVQIMMNFYSGNVFFTNSECQVAMMNGDDLESFYITPYHGYEGFADDLKEQYEADHDSWDPMDVEYLHNIGILSDEEWEEYRNAGEEND